MSLTLSPFGLRSAHGEGGTALLSAGAASCRRHASSMMAQSLAMPRPAAASKEFENPQRRNFGDDPGANAPRPRRPERSEDTP